MRLYVNVFGVDCTNHGITSGKDHAILIWDESDEEIAKNPPQHECVLVLRQPESKWARLRATPYGEKRWVMFGGNFVYTSDSRFPSKAPIHVHDRIE